MRVLASAAVVLALALTGGSATAKDQVGQILSAQYADPVAGGMGEQLFGGKQGDWRTLEVTVKTGKRRKDREVRRFVLPNARVFEDIEPHLADVTGDGLPEVLVVEHHVDYGPRLAIYNADGFVTATDWLGARQAWLAPVGAIDVDGDGAVEVAYVDRPHVRKVLSIYKFAGGHLTPMVEITPFTAHRMGDDYISGGTRTCRGTPAFILGNGDLSELVAVSWSGSRPVARAIGPDKGPQSLARALSCKTP